jgi:hypothetical protein
MPRALCNSTLLLFAATLATGCSGGKPPSVAAPDINPQQVAGRAVELYDANRDGSVDKDEAAKCPALAGAFAALDANGDGTISVSELETRLASLVGSGVNVVTFNCEVRQSGQPLAGAVVRFRPAEFFDGSLPAAEGTTDDMGLARPTIAAENLPTNLKNVPLIYPGLYVVEITHSTNQLPAKYNTASELGALVDPTSRTNSSTSARFDLKAN